MSKLSRVNKYKDLRQRLEEETTETSVKTKKEFSRSSKSHSLSHANQPKRAHQETTPTPLGNKMPNSPLMDDLIDEVKQYNLDNGNIVSDDTQINILKQLDGTQIKHRNSHFVPMEEDEQALGSTMKLPISEIEEAFPDEVPPVEKEEMEYYEEPAIDNGPDILPISGTIVKKVETLDEPEEMGEEEIEEEVEHEEMQQDTVEVQPVDVEEEMDEESVQEESIVLTHDDYQNAMELQENSEEDILDDYFDIDQDDENKVVRKPKKKKKLKKKDKMPSENKKEEVKEKKVQSSQQRNDMILNIILAILILALIAAIIFTVMMLSRIG